MLYLNEVLFYSKNKFIYKIDFIKCKYSIDKRISMSVVISKLESKTIKLGKFSSLSKLIPTDVNQIIELKFKNTNTPMVNAIRRTILCEMPVRYMSVSLSDIHTDDPYAINDVIRARLEMIPIDQTIPLGTNFRLAFSNESDEFGYVTSNHIVDPKNKIKNAITSDIPLLTINANTALTIENIEVVETFCYDNARPSFGRVYYHCDNHDMTKSCNISSPTDFTLGLETSGKINAKKVMTDALESLISRIKDIDYDLAKIEFGIYKLRIPNETYSIGKLIAYYVYTLVPDIKHVSMRLTHPSIREVIVDVDSDNAKELVVKACELIIQDLTSFKKQISK